MTRLNKFLSAKLAFCVAFVFIFNTIIQSFSYAEIAQVSILALPAPNQMLKASVSYSEPVLRGLKLDKNNPYKLDFIIDTQSKDRVSQAEVENLVKYFLAGLSIANEDIWVNLSPFEKDRILADSVAKTELGKDILIQDYILKQFSSSITDPQTDLGKKYWSLMSSAKVSDATALLNKIWISPDNAEVFQKDNVVLITKADLKVETAKDHMAKTSNDAELSDEIKSLILPVLSEEVNNGQSFTKLRQIFYSLILAKWFKESLRESVYKSYFDSESSSAIEHSAGNVKDKVFKSYVKSFQNGVYQSVLKERNEDNKLVKRQYFSGGAHMAMDLKRHNKLPSEFDNVDQVSDGSSAIASVSVMSSSIDVRTQMQLNRIRNFVNDVLLNIDFLQQLSGKQVFAEFIDMLKYLNSEDPEAVNGLTEISNKIKESNTTVSFQAQMLHQSVNFIADKFSESNDVKMLERLIVLLLSGNLNLPNGTAQEIHKLSLSNNDENIVEIKKDSADEDDKKEDEKQDNEDNGIVILNKGQDKETIDLKNIIEIFDIYQAYEKYENFIETKIPNPATQANKGILFLRALVAEYPNAIFNVSKEQIHEWTGLGITTVNSTLFRDRYDPDARIDPAFRLEGFEHSQKTNAYKFLDKIVAKFLSDDKFTFRHDATVKFNMENEFSKLAYITKAEEGYDGYYNVGSKASLLVIDKILSGDIYSKYTPNNEYGYLEIRDDAANLNSYSDLATLIRDYNEIKNKDEITVRLYPKVQHLLNKVAYLAKLLNGHQERELLDKYGIHRDHIFNFVNFANLAPSDLHIKKAEVEVNLIATEDGTKSIDLKSLIEQYDADSLYYKFPTAPMDRASNTIKGLAVFRMLAKTYPDANFNISAQDLSKWSGVEIYAINATGLSYRLNTDVEQENDQGSANDNDAANEKDQETDISADVELESVEIEANESDNAAKKHAEVDLDFASVADFPSYIKTQLVNVLTDAALKSYDFDHVSLDPTEFNAELKAIFDKSVEEGHLIKLDSENSYALGNLVPFQLLPTFIEKLQTQIKEKGAIVDTDYDSLVALLKDLEQRTTYDNKLRISPTYKKNLDSLVVLYKKIEETNIQDSNIDNVLNAKNDVSEDALVSFDELENDVQYQQIFAAIANQYVNSNAKYYLSTGALPDRRLVPKFMQLVKLDLLEGDSRRGSYSISNRLARFLLPKLLEDGFFRDSSSYKKEHVGFLVVGELDNNPVFFKDIKSMADAYINLLQDNRAGDIIKGLAPELRTYLKSLIDLAMLVDGEELDALEEKYGISLRTFSQLAFTGEEALGTIEISKYINADTSPADLWAKLPASYKSFWSKAINPGLSYLRLMNMIHPDAQIDVSMTQAAVWAESSSASFNNYRELKDKFPKQDNPKVIFPADLAGSASRIKVKLINQGANSETLDMRSVIDSGVTPKRAYKGLDKKFKTTISKSYPGITFLRTMAQLHPNATFNISVSEAMEWSGASLNQFKNKDLYMQFDPSADVKDDFKIEGIDAKPYEVYEAFEDILDQYLTDKSIESFYRPGRLGEVIKLFFDAGYLTRDRTKGKNIISPELALLMSERILSGNFKSKHLPRAGQLGYIRIGKSKNVEKFDSVSHLIARYNGLVATGEAITVYVHPNARKVLERLNDLISIVDAEQTKLLARDFSVDAHDTARLLNHKNFNDGVVRLSNIMNKYTVSEYYDSWPAEFKDVIAGIKPGVRILHNFNALYPNAKFDVELSDALRWAEVHESALDRLPELLAMFTETKRSPNNSPLMPQKENLLKRFALSISELELAKFTEYFLKSFNQSQKLDEVDLSEYSNNFHRSVNQRELIAKLIAKNYIDSLSLDAYSIGKELQMIIAQNILSKSFSDHIVKPKDNLAAVLTDSNNSDLSSYRNFADLLYRCQSLIKEGKKPTVIITDENRKILKQLYEILNGLSKEEQHSVLSGTGLELSTIAAVVNGAKLQNKVVLSKITRKYSAQEAYSLMSDAEQAVWRGHNGIAVLKNLKAKFDNVVCDLSYEELLEWTGANKSTYENSEIYSRLKGRFYNQNVNDEVELPDIYKGLSVYAVNDILQSIVFQLMHGESAKSFPLSLGASYRINEYSLDKALDAFVENGNLEHVRTESNFNGSKTNFFKLDSNIAIHALDLILMASQNSLTKKEPNFAFLQANGDDSNIETFNDIYQLLYRYNQLTEQGVLPVLGLSDKAIEILRSMSDLAMVLSRDDKHTFYTKFNLDYNVFKQVLEHRNKLELPKPVSELIKQPLDKAWEQIPAAYKTVYSKRSKNGMTFWKLMSVLYPNADFDITVAQATEWSGIASEAFAAHKDIKARFSSKKQALRAEPTATSSNFDEEQDVSSEIAHVNLEESLNGLVEKYQIATDDIRAMKSFMGRGDFAQLLKQDQFVLDQAKFISRGIIERELVRIADSYGEKFELTELAVVTLAKIILTQKTISSDPYGSIVNSSDEKSFTTLLDLLTYAAVNNSADDKSTIVLSQKARKNIQLLNNLFSNVDAAKSLKESFRFYNGQESDDGNLEFYRNLDGEIETGSNSQSNTVNETTKLVVQTEETATELTKTLNQPSRNVTKPSLSELLLKSNLVLVSEDVNVREIEIGLGGHYRLQNALDILEKQKIVKFDLMTNSVRFTDTGLTQMLRYLFGHSKQMIAFSTDHKSKPITSFEELYSRLNKEESLALTPWGKQIIEFMQGLDNSMSEMLNDENKSNIFEFINGELALAKFTVADNFDDLKSIVDNMELDGGLSYDTAASKLESKLLLLLESLDRTTTLSFEEILKQFPEADNMTLLNEYFERQRTAKASIPIPVTPKANVVVEKTIEQEIAEEEFKTFINTLMSGHSADPKVFIEMVVGNLESDDDDISAGDFQAALKLLNDNIVRLHKDTHGHKVISYFAEYLNNSDLAKEYKILILGSLNHWLSVKEYDEKEIIAEYRELLQDMDAESDLAVMTLNSLKPMLKRNQYAKGMYQHLLDEKGKISSSLTVINEFEQKLAAVVKGDLDINESRDLFKKEYGVDVGSILGHKGFIGMSLLEVIENNDWDRVHGSMPMGMAKFYAKGMADQVVTARYLLALYADQIDVSYLELARWLEYHPKSLARGLEGYDKGIMDRLQETKLISSNDEQVDLDLLDQKDAMIKLFNEFEYYAQTDFAANELNEAGSILADKLVDFEKVYKHRERLGKSLWEAIGDIELSVDDVYSGIDDSLQELLSKSKRTVAVVKYLLILYFDKIDVSMEELCEWSGLSQYELNKIILKNYPNILNKLRSNSKRDSSRTEFASRMRRSKYQGNNNHRSVAGMIKNTIINEFKFEVSLLKRLGVNDKDFSKLSRINSFALDTLNDDLSKLLLNTACIEQAKDGNYILSEKGVMLKLYQVLFSQSRLEEPVAFAFESEGKEHSFYSVFDMLYFVNMTKNMKAKVNVAVTSLGARMINNMQTLVDNSDDVLSIKRYLNLVTYGENADLIVKGTEKAKSFQHTVELNELFNNTGYTMFTSDQSDKIEDQSEYTKHDISFMPQTINQFLGLKYSSLSRIQFLHYILMTHQGVSDLSLESLSSEFNMEISVLTQFIETFYPTYKYLIDDYRNGPKKVSRPNKSNKAILSKSYNDFDILNFDELLVDLYTSYVNGETIILDKDTDGPKVLSSLSALVNNDQLDMEQRLTSLEMINYWFVQKGYDNVQILDLYSQVFESLEKGAEFTHEVITRFDTLGIQMPKGFYNQYVERDFGKASSWVQKKLSQKSAKTTIDGGVDFKFDINANSYDLPQVWQSDNAFDLSEIDYIVNSITPVKSLKQHLNI